MILTSLPMRFLVLALLLAPAASAQFGSGSSATYGSLGFNVVDTDDLSGRLSGAGYGDLEPDGVGIGTATYQFRGRFVGGVEGHTTGTETARVGGVEAQVGGRYALFNLGYDLLGRETAKAYPLVGVGYGDLTLRLAPTTDADFDRLLLDPTRGSALSTRGFLLNAGVGGDLILPFTANDDVASGLALGLRAGYLVALGGDDDWEQLATSSVTGAPDADLSGPYLRLLVGFGRVAR